MTMITNMVKIGKKTRRWALDCECTGNKQDLVIRAQDDVEVNFLYDIINNLQGGIVSNKQQRR